MHMVVELCRPLKKGQLKRVERMSVSIARSQYRKTESAAAPEVESPHKVILVTLTELDRSLAVLVAAQDQECALPDDHMNRCFTALYILQSSLDFEKGGDLAGSLFQIYEYARLQVLKAFRKELDADLEQAKLAIDGIRSAWAEIEDQV